MYPIYLLLLILPLFHFLYNYKTKTKSSSLPPSPPKLPIIGNLHQLSRGILHRSLYSLAEKYGPLISLQLGKSTGLVVSSPEMAEKIMKTNDLIFANRPKSIATKKLTYDHIDIGFAPYGDPWRNARKLSAIHLLSSKKVQSLQSVIDEEVNEMSCKIKEASATLRSEGDVSVNLSKILLSLTSDIMCRIIFGRKYSDDETQVEGGLKGVIADIQAMLRRFFVGDYLPRLWWIDVLTGKKRKLEKTFKNMNSFFEQAINEHRDPLREKHETDDFIDAMLHVQKDDKQQPPMTTDIMKSLLMNMLLTGSETTAATLEWTMSELIRNPSVLEKAQIELEKGSLDYLDMVLKETFRLHPPAPLLIHRESSEQCEIDGYQIPKGTIVYINAWAIGRDPNHWENTLDFEPERFRNNKVLDTNAQDFKLIPFGGGRRTCPGDHLGLSIIRTALATLLRDFDWELPKGMSKDDVNMDEAIGIATLRKTPLHLIPKPLKCC